MVTIDSIYTHFLQNRLVSTDSRKIVAKSIFFALKGENFNGNLYAKSALDKGATFAVVDETVDIDDSKIFLVDDVLKCLQNFAHRYRQEFDIPVIAITGSNGKTTTKELLASVLGTTYKTLFTEGNLNNHIGVPLTLLQLKKEHQIAIVEMGANHIGEIETLCKIANPSHGVITNIGKAHLEGFGGLEGVKKAKGELYDYLSTKNGVVFINRSESSLLELLKLRKLKAINFSDQSKKDGFVDIGIKPGGDYISVKLNYFDDESQIIQTQLQGDYNMHNLINSICIGIYFRVPKRSIKASLEAYRPQNNRSQVVIRGTNKFFLDAYNANPTSMHVSIANFRNVKHPNKIAILGDMYELGDYSEQEHKNVADLALSSGFNKVIFVGENFPQNNFKNVIELKEWFSTQMYENTYFLIKGSRGVQLEHLLQD